jgi:hypothetical protein
MKSDRTRVLLQIYRCSIDEATMSGEPRSCAIPTDIAEVEQELVLQTHLLQQNGASEARVQAQECKRVSVQECKITTQTSPIIPMPHNPQYVVICNANIRNCHLVSGSTNFSPSTDVL